MLEIAGQKFNSLTAIKPIGKCPEGILWECKCTCGKTCHASARALRRNHKKSCGCKKPIDMLGKKVGYLTVIEAAPRRGSAATWKCVCDCGQICIRTGGNLRLSKNPHCGCMKGFASKTHGMAKSKVWNAWQSMKFRCYNPKCKAYCRYGGRGITVCKAWKESFATFFADMGKPPTAFHTVDRIDNDGNYEPGNCRWATRFTHRANNSNTVMLTHRGKTMCLSHWAKRTGLSRDCLRYRIKANWPISKALTTPLRQK